MTSPAGSDDVGDGSDIVAVRRAFDTWQQVECSALSFDEQTWVGGAAIANDGSNRVYWEESADNWLGQPGTLALTFTFYTLGANRAITGADIVLNGVDWTWTTDEAQAGRGRQAPVDIETVVLHEVGHFFGLDHSLDPAAAMFPNNNKAVQRVPATDDIQGVCALYSNGLPAPGSSSGGAAVGAPCAAAGDCSSNLCIEDLQLARAYCSRRCLASQPDDCPAGFSCERSGVAIRIASPRRRSMSCAINVVTARSARLGSA